MKTSKATLIAAVMSILLVLSVGAILAQDATEEPSGEATSVPSSFTDNRINGDIYLAGLAIYCEDENGNTDTNTFQNGGIGVWGVGGQEYIHLTVDQLRGDEEIEQPPVPMAESTDEPMMEPTVDAMATDDPMATEEPMMAPVLLARATTPNGMIWLFRVADDTFALQGADEYGKFYTYTWTGCSLGVLNTESAPFAGMDDMMMATEEAMPMMATEEAAADS